MIILFAIFASCKVEYNETTLIISRENDNEQLTTPNPMEQREKLIINNYTIIPSNFLKNNNIVKILIINKAQTIEYNAFQNCSTLAEVYLHSSFMINIYRYAFGSCSNLLIFSSDTQCILGYYCFSNCQKLLNITNSTNLPEGCYFQCISLTTIVVPSSITYIDRYCFEGCSNIHTVIFQQGNVNRIELSSYSFYNCQNLKNLIVYRYIRIYDSNSYYYLNNVENLTYNSYDIDYNFAKYLTKLVNANITCENIPSSAFSGRALLKKLDFYGSSIYTDAFLNCVNLISVYASNVKTIYNNAFSGCNSLQNIEFPKIEIINQYAFNNCYNLQMIEFPETTKTISDYAFFNCNSLTKINLTQNIQAIYNYTFANCAQLQEVFIFANSNLTIKESAFNGSTNIRVLNISSAENTDIGSNAFGKLEYLERVDFYSGGNLTIGNKAFSGCVNLTSIFIHSNLILNIQSYAFAQLQNLTEVYITSSETVNIGESAFSNCISLTMFQSNVLCTLSSNSFYNCKKLPNITESTNLPYSCYHGCTSLTDINISRFVTSIDSYCFSDCSQITSVFIEYSKSDVITFKYNSFENCPNFEILSSFRFISLSSNYDDYLYLNTIKYLTIWTNLTNNNYGISNYFGRNFKKLITANITCQTINNNAFKSISSLQSLYFYGNNIYSSAFQNCVNLIILETPNIYFCDSYAFYNCHSLKSINFSKVNYIYSRTFEYCVSLTNIILSPNLGGISQRAFLGCWSLESIDFGNSITRIDYNAFYNCSKIYSINLPSTITTIGEYAFQSCLNLTILIIEKSTNTLNINSNTFDGCINVQILKVGRQISNLGYLPQSAANVTLYNFPNVTSMENFKNIRDLFIGESIKRISPNSFNSAKMRFIQFETSFNPIDINQSSFNRLPDLETLIMERDIVDFNAMNQFSSAVHIELDRFRIIPENGFIAFSNLETIRTGNYIESIGNNAFQNLQKLREVRFGSNLKMIGNYGFSDCIKLKYANLPNQISEIGVFCFCNCNELSNIIIPPSLPLIPSYAFCNTSITHIRFNYETTIDRNAFNNCNQLRTVEAFDYCVFMKDSFKFCDNINTVVFYEYVTFGVNTFSNLTNVSFYYYGFNQYYDIDTFQELNRLGIVSINVLKEYIGTIYGNISVKCICSSSSSTAGPENLSNPDNPHPNEPEHTPCPVQKPCSQIPFYSSFHRMSLKIRRKA